MEVKGYEIKNYMEDIVRERLEEILSKHSDICTCDQCRIDMICYA